MLGVLRETLRTMTAFTTITTVTTMRKVRYLGRGHRASVGLLGHNGLFCALLGWKLVTGSETWVCVSPIWAEGYFCTRVLSLGTGCFTAPETLLAQCDKKAGTPIPGCHLLPDERHSLGGLRHLLGDEEEEDSLSQENIDGDGAFLPTRCQGGAKAEFGTGQCCEHCPPKAKSPHPKAKLV